MDEEWKKGEWEPDKDINIRDPLRTTDEEWERLYKGESQGRNLMMAGGALLVLDLLYSILEAIGEWIDDIGDWIDSRRERRRNR